MKRRLLVILFLIASGAAVGLWLARPALTTMLRARLERELTGAVGSPSHVGDLTLSFVPPAAALHDVTIGEPPLMQVHHLAVRLRVLATLAEWRPVLSAIIDAPMVDLSHLPSSGPSPPPTGNGGAALPLSFHVTTVELADGVLRFPIGKATAELRVEHVGGSLEAVAITGRLNAILSAAHVELRRDARRLPVDEIRLDGGVDRAGLFVNHASLRGDGIALSAAKAQAAREYTVSSTLDLAHLVVIDDDLHVFNGVAAITGVLRGDLLDPQLDSQVTVTHAMVERWDLGEVRAHVTRAGRVLHVDGLHADSPLGQASGTGDFTFNDTVGLTGQVEVERGSPDNLLATAGVSWPTGTVLAATTTVDGTLDPLALSFAGNGALRAPSGDGEKNIASIRAVSTLHPHRSETQATLTQPDGNQLSATVSVMAAMIDTTFALTAPEVATLAPLLPPVVRNLDLAGRVDGSFTLKGPTAQPMMTGSVAARELTVLGAPVARLAGDFGIRDGALTTKAIRIETSNGAGDLSGALALDRTALNDWRLEAHDLALDALANTAARFAHVSSPLSGGTLGGRVSCHGPWAHPEVQATLSAKALHLFREPVERVDVTATAQWPQWTARVDAVHAATEVATIEAEGESSERLQLRVTAAPIHLANLHGAARRRLGGTVALHAQIAGEITQLGGTVEITGAGLAARGYQIGDVAVHAEGTRGDWAVRASALNESVTARATLQGRPPLPYTVALDWHDTNLARMLSSDRSLQVVTSGALQLAGTLSDLATPSGTLEINRFEASRDQYHVNAPEPVRVAIDRGRFRIASCVLTAQGSRLSVTGDGSTAGDVHLAADGDADLVLLELIGPPFSATEGQLVVTAKIAHAPGTPWNLHGSAAIRNAMLDLGLPVAFTATNGHFTLTGSSVVIDELSAKAGGGEVRLGGRIDLDRGIALTWNVSEVALSPQSGLEARLAGAGTVEGDWHALTVGGYAEILNALYDRNLELTDVLPLLRQQVAPAPRTQPPPVEVRVDLRVYAKDSMFIDNNIAKIELWSDLRVTGNVDAPVLTGTVGFLSGEVTFRGRTFTITGGTIDFRDPFRINPTLNITADSQIATADAEYTVTATVTGTTDNPRVEFSADDPSLSQNDVLSLVTFGKTSAQLRREGGGVSAGDLLTVLPTRPVEERVGKLIGVDRFEIEPVLSRDTGGFEPRVTIGKDLTDRLRALGSSSFGVESRHTVQLEYRLTRRISLLGSWESQTQSQAGAFGGDVKFRYEFRTLPFSLSSDAP